VRKILDTTSEQNHDSQTFGRFEIIWDSKQSELKVIDNGTGMTQEIIENHLLKVGSSRYQDETFKEKHPHFSPISRFGIGVLSAFMVADAVQILTCSPSEEKAREISLRSVHGKYLIRHVDKNSDLEAKNISPHGTKITLKFRPSARRVNVMYVAKQWIVFPKCKVTVRIDEQEPVVIGYESPKKALEEFLASNVSDGREQYTVVERHEAGVILAYVLRRDKLYNDWSFAPATAHQSTTTLALGTCVEGIRVEFTTPGFREPRFLAIANATGPNAPKTSVARSSLEDTEELSSLNERLYEFYRTQVVEESKRLKDVEAIPLSRIMTQIPFIASPLNDATKASYPELLIRSLDSLPIFFFLVEDAKGGRSASLLDVFTEGRFWTIECPLILDIDRLIAEMPVDVTARNLVAVAGQSFPELPDGPVVSNGEFSWMAREARDRKFEVSFIRAFQANRRVDFEWRPFGDTRVWASRKRMLLKLRELDFRVAESISHLFNRRMSTNMRRGSLPREIFFPLAKIKWEGLDGFSGVLVRDGIYFLPKEETTKYILNFVQKTDPISVARGLVCLEVMATLAVWQSDVDSAIDRIFSQMAGDGLKDYTVDKRELSSAILSSGSRIFDPFAWSKRGATVEEEADYDVGF
jgi:molecular chaperone HtpG